MTNVISVMGYAYSDSIYVLFYSEVESKLLDLSSVFIWLIHKKYPDAV